MTFSTEVFYCPLEAAGEIGSFILGGTGSLQFTALIGIILVRSPKMWSPWRSSCTSAAERSIACSSGQRPAPFVVVVVVLPNVPCIDDLHGTITTLS